MRRLIIALRLWRDRGLAYTWSHAWRTAAVFSTDELVSLPVLSLVSFAAPADQPAVSNNTGSAPSRPPWLAPSEGRTVAGQNQTPALARKGRGIGPAASNAPAGDAHPLFLIFSRNHNSSGATTHECT